jgi:tRNA G46 methylase TrmB
MSSFLSDGNFTPSWTDSERSLLASLSKEHQSVVQQHIQRYTDQIFQHVTNKLLADTTLDSDKLWQRATEKIRLARTKVLAQVGGTPPIKSAPVTTTSTTTSSNKRTMPTTPPVQFYDPYTCLGLEMPTHTSRAKQNRAVSTVGDWSIFSDPTLPLVVDVGCGSGQWALRAAFEEKKIDSTLRRNYLGLEIRKGLVQTASTFAEQLQLESVVGFWHGDITEEFWKNHLNTYPGKIVLFCCQLPDPRLRKNVKHGRRLLTTKRILQPELAQAVVSSMPNGGVIYVSSDYKEVAMEMKTTLEEHHQLERMNSIQDYSKLLILLKHPYKKNMIKADANGWLLANPFRLPTEREHFLHLKGDRNVFRVAYVSFFMFLFFLPSFLPFSSFSCVRDHHHNTTPLYQLIDNPIPHQMS